MARIPTVEGRSITEDPLRGKQQLSAPAQPRTPMPSGNLPQARTQIDLVNSTYDGNPAVLNGLARATEQASKAVMVIVDRGDKVQSDQAYTNLMRRYLDFEAEQRKVHSGERAPGFAAAVDNWWHSESAKVFEQLSPGAREKLAPIIANQALRSYGSALTHESNELLRAETNAFNASVAVDIESALRGDPAEIPGTVAVIKARVQDYGTSRGWSPDQVQESTRAFTSILHKGMVDQLMDSRDLRSATAYLDRHGGEMDAMQERAARASLKEQKRQENVAAQVHRLSQMPRDKAFEAARRLPADMQDAVAGGIARVFREQDQVKAYYDKQAVDMLQERAATLMEQGEPLTPGSFSAAEWDSIPPEWRMRVMDMAGELSAQEHAVRAATSVAEVDQLAAFNPDAFLDIDFSQVVPALVTGHDDNGVPIPEPLYLDTQQRAKYAELQSDMRNDTPGFRSGYSTTVNQIAKANGMDAEEQAQFNLRMREKVALYKEATGKKALSDADLKEIAFTVLLQSKTGRFGWSKSSIYDVETPAGARNFIDNIQVPPHEVARIRAEHKGRTGEYPTDAQVQQEYLLDNVLLNPAEIPTPYFQPGVAGVRHILGLDEPAPEPTRRRGQGAK